MNRSMMSRLTAAAVSVALLAAGLAGCGGSGDAETAEGEMIISVNNSEPQSPLVPSNTNEMGGGKVIRYLFEGLVSFDADGNQQLEVAKSITPNEDATQYTIELNEGWTFTNGEKVTASSFADAWSFAANVHNAQKQGSRMSVIQGYDELQDPSVAEDAKLSGLEVKDDYTLVVTLNQPDSVFPVQLAHQAFFPLPSAAYEDIDAFGHNPIGNGPYMLESWEPNKNIIVVPNPDYKGNRKVSNDGIEYRVYTDPEAAYADLSSGNLDVMDSVPASALETFQTDESIVAYSQSGSSYQGFIIPERLEHFGQDEEGQLRRQAISMAIDRDQIVSTAPKPRPRTSPRRWCRNTPTTCRVWRTSNTPRRWCRNTPTTCRVWRTSNTMPRRPRNCGTRPTRSPRGAANSRSPTTPTAATKTGSMPYATS